MNEEDKLFAIKAINEGFVRQALLDYFVTNSRLDYERLQRIELQLKEWVPVKQKHPFIDPYFLAKIWISGITKYIRKYNFLETNKGKNRCNKCHQEMRFHGSYPGISYGQNVCPGSVLVKKLDSNFIEVCKSVKEFRKKFDFCSKEEFVKYE